MELYQSHKKVRACPMTRGDYNELRGWRIPSDEDAEDAGYLVEYVNSPADNMPEPFENYISWCPKKEFEEGNSLIDPDRKVRQETVQEIMDSLTYVFNHLENTTVTTCHAFLPSGFTVGYGQSACINPDNYDPEIGEKIARENCELDSLNKIWQFEGYKLATQ